MILAERQLFALHPRALPRGLWALMAAVTILFAAMALLAWVGVMSPPTSHPAAAPSATRATAWNNAAVAKARDPACAAALSRARQTQGVSSQEAIAASTAMLRACDIR